MPSRDATQAPPRIAPYRPAAAGTPEESDLFAALGRGDTRARELLVHRFLPLARQIARRYHRGDEPFDDLLQVASLGLLKAIDRFDPERGLAFSSFAVPTISGEVRRHFRDRTWSMRVPRSLQELTLEVDKAAKRLTNELGRSPTVDQLSTTLGRTEEEILEALQARTALRTRSLDAPRGSEEDDDATVGDAVGSTDEGFARADARVTLDRLMQRLSDRDREIMRLRFEEDLTQTEIADIVGVSQMQVSRLVHRSLERMRAEVPASVEVVA